MRLRTEVLLLATLVIALTASSSCAEEERPPPVKLDKNLRRALLKALADLDEESAEQKSQTETREVNLEDSDLSTSINPSEAEESSSLDSVRSSIFSYDGFPAEEETPSEDKLQNTTFVEVDKYLATDNNYGTKSITVQKQRDENNIKAFQTHDVVLPDKSSAIYDKSPEPVNDQLETRSVKSSSSSNINTIDSSNSKTSNNYAESLVSSSSNGIATANALVAPSPTVSSPTVPTNGNSTSAASGSSSSSSSGDEAKTKNEKKEQEVKIFQAPLVAAFTVQQDERGVPKSVVPIYSPNGDGQALTLQEQLDFKQKLLERQLAELQAQQIQQTHFLVRQQQIYEQQLRQKQQQEFFLQEQSRLKQIQESERARLKQIEDQRNYQLQQQQQQQLQKQAQQFNLNQENGLLSLQPPLKTPNVSFQPSLTLDLPKPALPPTFQPSFHDQLRIQQLQRQQQQQAQLHQQQQLQQQRQQQLLHQQRLQQSFAPFPVDFQPPNSAPAQRFHRQEALGTVGNFGFNDNRQQTRNQFSFNQQSRGPQTFNYNPYQTQQQLQQQQQQQQFRTQRPQTPAKQIQHLLYQSGVAGDLGTVQGTGGQEDLNIVSKVLALNVGAVPTKNLRYPGNNFGNTGNIA